MELFFLFLLLVLLAFALGSGYPVAFALPGAAIISITAAAAAGYLFDGSTDAYFHSGGPGQWLSAGVTNLRGVYWEVERDTLIAIPLFIFMGIMLQRSKIAEDLLVCMAGLFGPVPGGLGISVVFVGALLAATTGIVGATVVAMGLISLPAMLRNNYSPSLASGTIAASGTLGQIIPPSIVLIILADQLASGVDQASTLRKTLYTEATGELSMPTAFDVTSTSAGEMFLGAFVPGILLVLIYMIYILVFALFNPKSAPAVPYEGQRDAKFWGNVALTLFPPLALIFLVLGSIIGGIATVNQAGAIGAAGALIMAGYRLYDGRGAYHPAVLAILSLCALSYAIANYDMNAKSITSPEDMQGIYIGIAAATLLIISLIWSGLRVLKIENTLHGVMLETAKTTSLVFIILLGAAMLTAAFRAFGGEELVRDFLNSLPGGFWTQFVIVMLVIFILGFFLDFIEIAVVVVPIVAPILLADPGANITAVWLGVMIGLNIQTSFLTPPFGFALFYLRGVAPAVVKTMQMYKGVIAFIALQLIALLIVGLYPPLVNYLPNRVSLLGETAPPPRNPKLQFCLADFVHDRVTTDGGATLAVISDARSLDLSGLPEDLADDFTSSLDDAEAALAALDEVWTAHDAVEAAAPAYRPILAEVRRHEKDVRKEREEIDALQTRLSRMRGESDEAKAKVSARIEELEADAARLEAEIPADWPDTYAAFSELAKAEEDARRKWERSGDDAYQDAVEVLEALSSSDAFLAAEGNLDRFRNIITGATEDEAEAAEDAAKDIEDIFGDIAGADDVKSALSKARRALRKRSFDPAKAMEEFEEAVTAYNDQKNWRKNAAPVLIPEIEAYVAAIRDTIGARSQDRMTDEQALYLASCTANHRNLSLNF
ncbi:MAG: SLC13 family permease [Pseudomonadota bacterium]